MRELYDALPKKPEWLTAEAIDRYAAQMAAPYQVAAYHHFENGFDDKLDYQTLEEAETAAQGYVAGTIEEDGFAYDGAAVYDAETRQCLRVYGDYPDKMAQQQAAAFALEHGTVPPNGKRLPAFLDMHLIEANLLDDGGRKHKRQEIFNFFQSHKSLAERTEFLKNSYKDIWVEVLTDGVRSGYVSKTDGKQRTEYKTIDFAELLRVQIADVTDLLSEKEISLSVNIPDKILCDADPAQMERAIQNVLVNAIRYSPNGEAIYISLSNDKNTVSCKVENTGVHIPEEMIPHLFEAFYRADTSRNRNTGGTGLGLYIVRKIMELHHAKYGIQNTSKGVVFWLEMPQERGAINSI